MSYSEFWPIYLAAHTDPRTRAVHYLGTLAGLAALVIAAVSGNWFWLVAAPVLGYRPATFAHPGWSLYSDFRMLGLFLAGRLSGELQRAGVGGHQVSR